MPTLEKIDHIHVYTPNRLAAEKWYKKVLGFTRVKSLEVWFVEGGPLTIANGGVHIALFEHQEKIATTIAFSVDALNYKAWQHQLSNNKVSFTEYDHDLSWSIYFTDPYGNPYEITSYDYQEITNSKKEIC